jgi:hypothetical protein
MALFQIVYSSTAAKSLGRAELMDLLNGSVGRNARAGITGLLLYKDGAFMQAIEGEEESGDQAFLKNQPRPAPSSPHSPDARTG